MKDNEIKPTQKEQDPSTTLIRMPNNFIIPAELSTRVPATAPSHEIISEVPEDAKRDLAQAAELAIVMGELRANHAAETARMINDGRPDGMNPTLPT